MKKHPLFLSAIFIATLCVLQKGTAQTGITKLGTNALAGNTTGDYNTAIGYYSLYRNTTGSMNSATGAYSMYYNTSGVSNTANGYYSLLDNISGEGNTAIGFYSLSRNTSANYNTAIGGRSLYFNTSGFANTASGYHALYNNTTAKYNTASGYQSLYSNTTGNSNTATGNGALRNNLNGSWNTAVGDSAGATFNANYSTFIGYKTAATVANLTNVTLIGNQAYATASNQVRIGNGAVTSIGGKVGWSTLSDGRFKKNLQADVPGLEFIVKLKPVTYTLDIDRIDYASGISQQPSGDQISARAEALKQKYTGFVAQEVEAVANQLNYDFSGVDKPKNDKDFYGLRYAEFVVPLVKAVQELNHKTEEENKQLKEEVAELRKLVMELKNGNVRNDIKSLSSAYLEQNAPNPSMGATTIRYYVPAKYNSAKLTITDAKGRLIKDIILTDKGAGKVYLNSNLLLAGTYVYSLWMDGQQVDSKQLIIGK